MFWLALLTALPFCSACYLLSNSDQFALLMPSHVEIFFLSELLYLPWSLLLVSYSLTAGPVTVPAAGLADQDRSDAGGLAMVHHTAVTIVPALPRKVAAVIAAGAIVHLAGCDYSWLQSQGW